MSSLDGVSVTALTTYDEYGGRWDHVPPPRGDRWGPGTRIPAIIVSPYAKKGFVDHTQYDTTSILKLIETRWGLAALGQRDAAADGLTNAGVGERLYISRRTVSTHLSHIFAKLGIKSRVELAAGVLRHRD